LPAGNEEASAVLNLGEFQDVETLTLSEASLIINAIASKRRNANDKTYKETEYVSCLVVSTDHCHSVEGMALL
jgi:DNA-directed RNA polymerase II subunit RPB4